MKATKFVSDAFARIVKWPLLALVVLLSSVVSQPSMAGTITIVKDAQPNDAQDFSFYAFGPNSACCMPFQLDDDAGASGANNILSNSKTWTLAAGSYSFKEDFANPTPTVGWTLASINCTPPGSAVVDMASKSFTVNLTANGNITCTFVNKKATGTVTIIKTIVPSTDPGKFTLQLKDSNNLLIANFLNGGNGATLGPQTVAIGNYNVSEIAGAGTSLANYTSVITGTGCAANGNVTVAAGDNKVCKITNTKVVGQGKVTVRKLLVPSTDPGKFTLQLKDSSGTVVASFPNGGNGAVLGPVAENAGTYTVGEIAGIGTSMSNYTSVISGVGCNPNGTITVTAGNGVSCIITNTRIGQGKVTVTKVLVPATDPGKFTLQLKNSSGTVVASFPNGGNGAVLGPVAENAGTYTVGEIAGNATNMANYTSVISGTGCNPNGTITVTAGNGVNCIITNTRKGLGKVTVTKVLVPATDPGKFTLQFKDTSGTVLASFPNGGNGALLGPLAENAGTYTIGEVAGNSTNLANYTSVISGAGCNPNGTITVTAGNGTYCIITNTRIVTQPCTGYPMVADVYIYNPMSPFGPQSVDICRGGHVVFHNVNSGAPWKIVYLTGNNSFADIPLLTNGTFGSTGALNTMGTAIGQQDEYKIAGNPGPDFVVHGFIKVH